VYRILLRVAIIALVCSAVIVLTILKYTTNDDGLRASVVTVRIPPSGIGGLSAQQVHIALGTWPRLALLSCSEHVLYGRQGQKCLFTPIAAS
jgi:hypothetical protein